MAELDDLQKLMAEATQQRSSITTALLAIQKSLDKMQPTVTKREPVLASLKPAVNELPAWRSGVDTAVGKVQTDIGDILGHLAKIATRSFPTSSSSTMAPSRCSTECLVHDDDWVQPMSSNSNESNITPVAAVNSNAVDPIVPVPTGGSTSSPPAITAVIPTASDAEDVREDALPATSVCSTTTHNTCSTSGLGPVAGTIQAIEVPLSVAAVLPFDLQFLKSSSPVMCNLPAAMTEMDSTALLKLLPTLEYPCDTSSSSAVTVRILSSDATCYEFSTLPWDPGQRAVDLTALIHAQGCDVNKAEFLPAVQVLGWDLISGFHHEKPWDPGTSFLTAPSHITYMMGSMQEKFHLSLLFSLQFVQQTNGVFEAPACWERHRIRIFWSGVAPSLLMTDLLQENLNEKPQYNVTITSCESVYELLHTSVLLWRISVFCISLCCSARFQWKVAWLFYHLYDCYLVALLRPPMSTNYFTQVWIYTVHKQELIIRLSTNLYCGNTTKSDGMQGNLSSFPNGIIVNDLYNLRVTWCPDHVLLRITNMWLHMQCLQLVNANYEASIWTAQHNMEKYMQVYLIYPVAKFLSSGSAHVLQPCPLFVCSHGGAHVKHAGPLPPATYEMKHLSSDLNSLGESVSCVQNVQPNPCTAEKVDCWISQVPRVVSVPSRQLPDFAGNERQPRPWSMLEFNQENVRLKLPWQSFSCNCRAVHVWSEQSRAAELAVRAMHHRLLLAMEEFRALILTVTTTGNIGSNISVVSVINLLMHSIDTHSLGMLQASRGFWVNALKSFHASVVSLVRRQLLIHESDASIMLLGGLRGPVLHLTLKILDAVHVNTSLIYFMGGIKYSYEKLSVAPQYCGDQLQRKTAWQFLFPVITTRSLHPEKLWNPSYTWSELTWSLHQLRKLLGHINTWLVCISGQQSNAGPVGWPTPDPELQTQQGPRGYILFIMIAPWLTESTNSNGISLPFHSRKSMELQSFEMVLAIRFIVPWTLGEPSSARGYAKFQGGRCVMLMPMYLHQVRASHKNYFDFDQQGDYYLNDAFVEFAHVHLDHCFYSEGYHCDYRHTKDHRVSWDPGGEEWRRLEVKPSFKDGGMSWELLAQSNQGSPRPAQETQECHKAQPTSRLCSLIEYLSASHWR